MSATYPDWENSEVSFDDEAEPLDADVQHLASDEEVSDDSGD